MAGSYPDSMVSTPIPETDKPGNPHRPRDRSVVAIVGIGGGIVFGVQPLLNLLLLPTWLNGLLMVVALLAALEVFGRVMGWRYPDDPRFGRFIKDWAHAVSVLAFIGIFEGISLAFNHLSLPIWLLLPLILVAALAALEVFWHVMRQFYPDDPRFAGSFVPLFGRVVGRRNPDDPHIGRQRCD